MKPILNPIIADQVESILAPFSDPIRWQSLQLNFCPFPTAIVMLIGEPGTGKTTLARYMARRISQKKLPEISFGHVASAELGATEKAIIAAFEKANDAESPALFLDECDAILWDRSRVTEESMHMLSIVNTTLTELDKFTAKGGLVVLATNHHNLLDPALKRRITDTIHLFPLSGEAAAKVWRSKLPRTMSPPHSDTLQQLCITPITPAKIEHVVLHACRTAFRRAQGDRLPTMLDIIEAHKIVDQQIRNTNNQHPNK